MQRWKAPRRRGDQHEPYMAIVGVEHRLNDSDALRVGRPNFGMDRPTAD